MSINQYYELIKAFYRRHKQINTTESGNQFDFNANDKHLYPVAHVEYISDGSSGNNKTYNFLITLADLFDPNINNEDEIYSDMSQVADDTVNYFSNLYDQEYSDVSQNITKRKFNNGHTDNLRGQTFILTFEEFDEKNDCNIPLKD